MFEVDLESVDLGEWFSYQNSHLDQEKEEWIFEKPVSDKVRVRVRLLFPYLKERANKRKKTAEHILNPKTRQMERITYYEELTPEETQKEIDNTWDYAITGLEGFKDKKTGKVLECTKETKLKLMQVPSFDRFIGHCLKILEGSEAKQREESEKNLQTG